MKGGSTRSSAPGLSSSGPVECTKVFGTWRALATVLVSWRARHIPRDFDSLIGFHQIHDSTMTPLHSLRPYIITMGLFQAGSARLSMVLRDFFCISTGDRTPYLFSYHLHRGYMWADPVQEVACLRLVTLNRGRPKRYPRHTGVYRQCLHFFIPRWRLIEHSWCAQKHTLWSVDEDVCDFYPVRLQQSRCLWQQSWSTFHK